ncbi:hypothetical protein [Rhizobium sp. BK376]|uniref:hypothetical protein n=1 Tax=Rhizobium sp. BK376 TaxID=2512149 RepID=UPI0010F02375|nr:hypothetical protein EV561_11837 [Rhizobium sp. BK376]
MQSNSVLALLLAAGIGLAAGIATAQEGPEADNPMPKKIIGQTTPKESDSVSSLAVINSDGATLEGDKLTLTGVSNNSIVFADRPVRAAGHVTTAELVKAWNEGPDSLSKDPPNATISVLGSDSSDVADAVVTLKSPKLEGTNLTFDVAVLEGSIAGKSGPAALFIDHWHGHGAWYGVGLATGAALGLGAAAAVAGAPVYAAPAYAPPPYYYPPYGEPYYYHRPPYHCGYYPYPPCY